MSDESALDHAMESAALRSVRAASVVCRHVQHQIDTLRAISKDDKSPVTIADFASQAVVAYFLCQELGAIQLVAEEDAAALRTDEHATTRQLVLDAVRIAWPEASEDDVLEAIDIGNHDGSTDRFWTLDPIDGTKGFLRGQQYAVSLSYIKGSEPVLGVLGCPNLSPDLTRAFDAPDPLGTLYVASKGGGVSVGTCSHDGSMEALARRERPDSSIIRLCESVESAHTKHDASARVLESLGMGSDPQRLDSQCKYAVVARGQADAYLRMPTKKGYVEKIWDHAAGAIVATEMGCRVSDVSGEPLDFGHGSRLEHNRGVICADAEIHESLVGAIADLGLNAPA
ncbi:MAG: 3'(2'),5'-bisphosphate nucleotidase [Planctomycetota bacterium]|jgi:3'(2'), 5'-bisphosphate nucleotidase